MKLKEMTEEQCTWVRRVSALERKNRLRFFKKLRQPLLIIITGLLIIYFMFY
jgi:hypothetical protein